MECIQIVRASVQEHRLDSSDCKLNYRSVWLYYFLFCYAFFFASVKKHFKNVEWMCTFQYMVNPLFFLSSPLILMNCDDWIQFTWNLNTVQLILHLRFVRCHSVIFHVCLINKWWLQSHLWNTIRDSEEKKNLFYNWNSLTILIWNKKKLVLQHYVHTSYLQQTIFISKCSSGEHNTFRRCLKSNWIDSVDEFHTEDWMSKRWIYFTFAELSMLRYYYYYHYYYCISIGCAFFCVFNSHTQWNLLWRCYMKVRVELDRNIWPYREQFSSKSS